MALAPDDRLISYVVPVGQSRSRRRRRSHEQYLRDAAGEAGVDLVIEHLETELRGIRIAHRKDAEEQQGLRHPRPQCRR